MVRARPFTVLELCLCDGGAEVDIPQSRSFLRVCLTATQVAKECRLTRLASMVTDRGIQKRPVDGQPESAEQILEHLFVLVGEFFAQRNEIRPRDRHCAVIFRDVTTEGWCEVRVVCDGRITRDAEVVLYATFGRETIVVPAHRIEDTLATHAPEASERVGVGVTEDVTHVQRAGYRRRRSVDCKDGVAGGGAVESVDALGFPALHEARLEILQRRLFGDVHRGSTVLGLRRAWRVDAPLE